jgi:hypothetical protein
MSQSLWSSRLVFLARQLRQLTGAVWLMLFTDAPGKQRVSWWFSHDKLG